MVTQVPPGIKWFTVLDGRHGYFQVPLDNESKKIALFITPLGLHHFKHNAMDLISLGYEHIVRGDLALAGVDNVKKIVEDILIYDEDYNTHIAEECAAERWASC